MKTPLYETSAGALKALLATRSFVFADLYTITTANAGPVMRYTTADLDIAWGANTWAQNGPLFDQDATTGSAPRGHWKIGLDVDTWSFVVMPRLTDPISGASFPDTIAGTPWIQAAAGGALDGATVTVDRAYLTAWPTGTIFNKAAAPVGVINIFTGRVAAVDVGRTRVAISVNSHLELLGVSMPRNLFQASCRRTLFDARCTLSAAAYAVPGTVAASSTQLVIRSLISGPAGSGTYALGRIEMTSGANATFSRSIRTYTAGSPAILTLLAPFTFPIAVGDTFNVYPGCDKQEVTCGLFGNVANFRGEKYIPAPETAL